MRAFRLARAFGVNQHASAQQRQMRDSTSENGQAISTSNDPGDLVHGEPYRLLSPALLLVWLDAYEGIGSDVQYPEYARIVCNVRLEFGRQFDAWVYEYPWPITNEFLLSNSQALAPAIHFQPSSGPATTSELDRHARPTEIRYALSGT
jgi:hypothetical protein